MKEFSGEGLRRDAQNSDGETPSNKYMWKFVNRGKLYSS
jgi:hypothetical protein